MSGTFEMGDIVILADIEPAMAGVVCRVLIDGGVQAFFAEGPHEDSYTTDIYPPEWLMLVARRGVGSLADPLGLRDHVGDHAAVPYGHGL